MEIRKIIGTKSATFLELRIKNGVTLFNNNSSHFFPNYIKNSEVYVKCLGIAVYFNFLYDSKRLNFPINV